MFFRSLSVLLSSGVGIERSLLLLGDGTDDPRMAEVSRGLARCVRQGLPISTGMAGFPKAFDEMHLGLVEIGEGTGTLDHLLDRLGEYEDRRRAILLKLKSALTYPAFLAFFSILLLVLVPPFLFDRALEVTRDSGVEPPFLTRLMLGYADLVRWPAFWPALVALLAGTAWAVRRSLRRPGAQLALARRLARVPALGRLLEASALARFSRSLALQMQAGVNPLRALPLASRASDHPILQLHTPAMVEGLKDGEQFYVAFARCELFRTAWLQMVRVGEESGRLPDVLDRLAASAEQNLDHAIQAFAALVEPAIMLVMGGIVGFVVLATLTPMTLMLQKL